MYCGAGVKGSCAAGMPSTIKNGVEAVKHGSKNFYKINLKPILHDLCLTIWFVKKIRRLFPNDISEVVIVIVISMFFLSAIDGQWVIVILGVSLEGGPSIPSRWNMFYSTRCFFRIIHPVTIEVLSCIESWVSLEQVKALTWGVKRLIPGYLSLEVSCKGVLLRTILPLLRGAPAWHRVVGNREVVEVLPCEHTWAAWAANRCIHKSVGECHTFIWQEWLCLVQCLIWILYEFVFFIIKIFLNF